jgi:hypothetical protein
VAGFRVDVPPSPKLQLKVKGPTPPVGEAVKVTSEVASGEVGLTVKLTAGAGATVMVWLDVAFAPVESVALTLTVKDPDEV